MRLLGTALNVNSRETQNIGVRLHQAHGETTVFLWAKLDHSGGVAQQIDAVISTIIS